MDVLEGAVRFSKWPTGLALIGISILTFVAASGVAEILKAEIRPSMKRAISFLFGTSTHMETRLPSQSVLLVRQNKVSKPEVAQVSSNDLRYWTSHYMGREVELADMHCTPKDQGAQCFSRDGLLAVGAVLARPTSAQDVLRRSCTQPDAIVSSPQCVWTIRFTPEWQQDHMGIHEGKVVAAKIMELSRP
jgi:hypothetical protein